MKYIYSCCRNSKLFGVVFTVSFIGTFLLQKFSRKTSFGILIYLNYDIVFKTTFLTKSRYLFIQLVYILVSATFLNGILKTDKKLRFVCLLLDRNNKQKIIAIFLIPRISRLIHKQYGDFWS